MPMEKPSREQLIYWLIEASEIEHHLMCCCLYAAFSLKRHDARWTPGQAAVVERRRAAIEHFQYFERHAGLEVVVGNDLHGRSDVQ